MPDSSLSSPASFEFEIPDIIYQYEQVPDAEFTFDAGDFIERYRADADEALRSRFSSEDELRQAIADGRIKEERGDLSSTFILRMKIDGEVCAQISCSPA